MAVFFFDNHKRFELAIKIEGLKIFTDTHLRCDKNCLNLRKIARAYRLCDF